MKKYVALFFGISLACHALAQDPAVPCITQLKEDARVQILAEKFIFDVTKGQPLEVLANKSKPTVKEKTALSFLASESERCLDLGAEWRQKNLPVAINALINSYRLEMLSALADLFAGSITYGDIAKFRAKKAADLKNSADAVYRDIEALFETEEKQRQEAEIQQRQVEMQAQERRNVIAQQQQFARQQADQQQEQARRLAAMQNFKIPEVDPTPFFRPSLRLTSPQTTNCTRYGNSMSCTTN